MSLQIGNIVKLTAEMEKNTAYFAIKGENWRGKIVKINKDKTINIMGLNGDKRNGQDLNPKDFQIHSDINQKINRRN